MNKVYGYCRVSTQKQSIERQIRNIKADYPGAVIVTDEYTGTTMNRNGWDKLNKVIRPGDTIIFDSVSRMSRNAEEGFQTYKELYHNGIRLVFLKEPHINTDTYEEAMNKRVNVEVDTGDTATNDLVQAITEAVSRYMLALAERQIRLAFEQSEKEVEDLHQRTREGIQTARLNGKQIGQREGSKLTTKKSVDAKAVIRQHSTDFGGTLNDIDCMKLAGVSRNSYYKYKREIKEEITQ